MKMTRTISPMALMFTAISGIVGSAWLFGPLYASQIAGPGSLLSWLIGAIAMLVIAMTLAELTSMFPVTGAHARFMLFSHGALSSFVFGWIMWLGYATVAPAETMGILQYLGSSFPILLKTENGTAVLSDWGYLASAGILFLMCLINCIGVKWLTRYNAVMVWIKLIVPLAVGIIIIALLFQPHNFVTPSFMPNGWQSTLSALSMGGVIFAFAGSAPAITLTGEAKNAQKTIPFVLAGALLISFAIYFLLQVAFIGAVSPAALTHGWTHLQFPGSNSPFIGIAEGLHQGWLHYLILVTAIITPIGTAVIFVATSSRTAYALSENGFFPKMMEKLNHRKVPYMGVMLNFVVGMILFFPVPGWQGMMGFLIAAFVLGYSVGPLSIMALRKQLPDYKRTYKVPCFRIWCYLSFFFANLILYWTGWAVYSKMLIAIALGLVVMAIYQVFRKQRVKLDFRHGVWSIVYIYGLGVISKLGNFGGGTGLINDHWDMPAIAAFSLVLMIIAQYYALPAKTSQHYVDQIRE